MKTIKIFCLFTILFVGFVSCENEDGEVCYPVEGDHERINVAIDSTANSQADRYEPTN